MQKCKWLLVVLALVFMVSYGYGEGSEQADALVRIPMGRGRSANFIMELWN